MSLVCHPLPLLSKTSLKLGSIFANDLLWPKIPITHSKEPMEPNKLQTSHQEKSDGNSVDVSVCLWFPAEENPPGKHFSMPDGASCRIAWKMIRPTNPNKHAWRPIVYFSVLPYGWIPSDGIDFFGQFILYLRDKWLEVCDKAEEHLSATVSHAYFPWINRFPSLLY
jgi:tRNA splicing endonuclease